MFLIVSWLPQRHRLLPNITITDFPTFVVVHRLPLLPQPFRPRSRHGNYLPAIDETVLSGSGRSDASTGTFQSGGNATFDDTARTQDILDELRRETALGRSQILSPLSEVSSREEQRRHEADSRDARRGDPLRGLRDGPRTIDHGMGGTQPLENSPAVMNGARPGGVAGPPGMGSVWAGGSIGGAPLLGTATLMMIITASLSNPRSSLSGTRGWVGGLLAGRHDCRPPPC